MDIYNQRSRWKILLALAALAFMSFILIYTWNITSRLAERELKTVEMFKILSTEMNKTMEVEELDEDLTTFSSLIDKVNHIPVIFESDTGELKGFNLNGESDESITDQEFLRKRIEDFKDNEPLEGIGYAAKVHFNNTKLYDQLTLFPYLTLLFSSLFVGLGYYLFNSARNAEQSRVWAGMAKETAHQLGTPISAIIAWIEHLKLELQDKGQLEIVDELRNDVTRLELVADRFSKIGSEPDLTKTPIVNQLQECIEYMDRRAPKRVSFEFENSVPVPFAMINSHLFNWVVENIYRNALDSMDNTGSITTRLYEDGDSLAIDIQDTGKGIPSSKFKTIFQPGYSTKTRGWGLGLSLAKRIIENYHKGKIFVKDSKVDHGTTFAIRLPKV
jgi:signal transduction histidine kinase